MGNVRRVTINISSACNTPFIHQPVIIQLSADDSWVPPTGPIRIPPAGDPPALATSILVIANSLQTALQNASQVRNSGVGENSGVFDPATGNLVPLNTPPRAVPNTLSIEVAVRNEFDFGYAGDGKKGQPGPTQLKISVDVAEGEEDDPPFRVKRIASDVVWAVFRGLPFRLEGKKTDGKRTPASPWGPYGPDDVEHETTVFTNGKGGRVYYSGNARLDVRGVGAATMLDPAFGPDLSMWEGEGRGAFGIGRREELEPMSGEVSAQAAYYADGFYYPSDNAAIRDGAEISIETIGLRRGRRGTPGANSSRPLSVRAMESFVRELSPAVIPPSTNAPPAIPDVGDMSPPTPAAQDMPTRVEIPVGPLLEAESRPFGARESKAGSTPTAPVSALPPGVRTAWPISGSIR